MSRHRLALVVILVLVLTLSATAANAAAPDGGAWPALAQPAPREGGGGRDAAVIVSIEDYASAPDIPGAEANGRAWYLHLTKTRGVPTKRVVWLKNEEGAKEEIEAAVAKAAKSVQAGGTLWFVFIGHGAPAKSRRDGVLVGWDARQTASSLFARSVTQGDVMAALEKGRQAQIIAVIDACFSARGSDGSKLLDVQPLVVAPPATSGATVLSAGAPDQFAGPLPGVARPAFSYLVLGALRGWGDQDRDGRVTAKEAVEYARDVLASTLKGRSQQPQLIGGNAKAVLARPKRSERAPDVASIVAGGKRRAGPTFTVSVQPGAIERPGKLDAVSVRRAAIDDVDVKALELYDNAIRVDESGASAVEKKEAWLAVARHSTQFRELARERVTQWEAYIAMEAARAADYKKLARLLDLRVVADDDKLRWIDAFLAAYGADADENPHVAALGAARAKLQLPPRVWIDRSRPDTPDGPFEVTARQGEQRFACTLTPDRDFCELPGVSPGTVALEVAGPGGLRATTRLAVDGSSRSGAELRMTRLEMGTTQETAGMALAGIGAGLGIISAPASVGIGHAVGDVGPTIWYSLFTILGTGGVSAILGVILYATAPTEVDTKLILRNAPPPNGESGSALSYGLRVGAGAYADGTLLVWSHACTPIGLRNVGVGAPGSVLRQGVVWGLDRSGRVCTPASFAARHAL